MAGFDVTLVGALTAGVLTFLSPCILPLVPAYLCFISGMSLDQITASRDGAAASGRGVFMAGVAFVLGLSLVFVLMGAAATGLGQLVAAHKRTLAVVGGGIIILFGLHYMGVFRIGFLNFEKRIHLQNKPAGLIGAFLIGLAFGFGWTPCVGPILSTILMIAATGEEGLYGVTLLSTFAAGLGIPFLLAALAAGPFMRFLSRFRRHMRKVELAVGAFLIGTGMLIITGGLSDVTVWMLEAFPSLGGMN
ncbi:cytochrome c biogenesis CcdA family protein [Novispirillum sp. DQ9]|uniref:cytochrome c biogenesis CcdA family protein n=1 Tax=Novispirillum sp. DQ9 TaxID=3398612 RepID=UPI003C7DBF90